MSDFSQELIDQLCLAIEEKVEKNLDVIIQKKVEAEVEKQVEKVMKKLREELQPRARGHTLSKRERSCSQTGGAGRNPRGWAVGLGLVQIL
eukprot:XP_001689983.1 predicted protein [Chlamydomonas reinhardtii]